MFATVTTVSRPAFSARLSNLSSSIVNTTVRPQPSRRAASSTFTAMAFLPVHQHVETALDDFELRHDALEHVRLVGAHGCGNLASDGTTENFAPHLVHVTMPPPTICPTVWHSRVGQT